MAMARIELFLVWESNCRNILDEIQSLPEKILEAIKVRIFLRKDTPSKNRPPDANWIELYHSFTTSPHASDTTLAAFLIKHFKDLAFFNDEEGTTDSSCDPVQFYFVVDSETERKFEELIAILGLECKSNVKMKTINGQEEDIPNVLGYHFCKECNLVFDNEDELNEHGSKVHNFFCDNPSCQRNKTRFYNARQLAAHQSRRTTCLRCHADDRPTFCDLETKTWHMRNVHGHDAPTNGTSDHSTCDFCPSKVFSSPEQKDSHMRNAHKKCNCGCAVYFETRRHYLEHFYTVYPLACFENRKCPHRFQTVFHQAEHHKNVHNSQHSYYCATCSTRGDTQGVVGRVNKTCAAFKDEKTLRHHGALMKHSSEEMFLIEGSPSKPTAKSSAINYC